VNDIERILGRVLGIGIAVSTAALAAGLAIMAVPGGHVLAARLLTAGVLILIGTPVARVVVSTIAYSRRREWIFTVLTVIVLGELIASIIAAFSGRS
jgi:uncharacterized membrane protein